MHRPLQIALSVLFCIGSATASDQDLEPLMDSIMAYIGSVTASDQALNALMEHADLSNTIRLPCGLFLCLPTIADMCLGCVAQS